MVIFITAAVFIALIVGVLSFYLLLESRRESLPHRFREVIAPAGPAGGKVFGNIGKWVTDAWKRITAKASAREDLIAIFAGEKQSAARLRLNQAGHRSAFAYQVYWVARVVLPVLFLIGAFIYGKFLGLSNQKILLFVFMGFALGYVLPGVYLGFRIRKRQEDITDALPDALDLLVVCVEAGLGLNAAFVKITEEFKLSSRTLSEEFDIVNREMVAGKPRQEALRALADRTGVEEVQSLVAMLIQTEKLGTSLAQSLRVHSDSMRTRRRQRAEEAAAKTTIKLVFPLVFLMFPALFIVILGPGFIQIVKILLPVAGGAR